MGWQKRESAGLDSHDQNAVNRKLEVYLGVSHNPDFFQIAPILLASSSGFQCVKISQNIQEKLRSATVNLQLRPKLFLDEAKKCKEPRVCFVKRPSATPFTNWSTSTQNSSFAQGSRQRAAEGRCLPGNRCSGPCGYVRRSFTFRPRVQCCVAWYNALPAHLPLSLIHIWRCRRSTLCRSRWSPYH